MSQHIITLNVGGRRFQTLHSTLGKDKNSMIYTMLQSELKTLDSDGSIFVDRDPDQFAQLLNFLRNGYLKRGLTLPELYDLWREADFYQMTDCLLEINKEIHNLEWKDAEEGTFWQCINTKYIIFIKPTINISEGEIWNIDFQPPLGAVKVEVNSDENHLYKFMDNYLVMDSIGRKMPGLMPMKEKRKNKEIYFNYTRGSHLKGIPRKSVFFLIKNAPTELEILQLMKIERMILSNWTFYFDKAPFDLAGYAYSVTAGKIPTFPPVPPQASPSAPEEDLHDD